MKTVSMGVLVLGAMFSLSAFAAANGANYACALNSSTGLEPVAFRFEPQNTVNAGMKTVDLGSIRAGIQVWEGKLQLYVGQKTPGTEVLYISSPSSMAEFEGMPNVAKAEFSDSSGWYSLVCVK